MICTYNNKKSDKCFISIKYETLYLIHSQNNIDKNVLNGNKKFSLLEYFLHYVRSEVVQQSAEGQAVPPGCGEVGDLHSTIVLGDLAAPGQQRLASIGFPSENWAWDGTGLSAEKISELVF